MKVDVRQAIKYRFHLHHNQNLFLANGYVLALPRIDIVCMTHLKNVGRNEGQKHDYQGEHQAHILNTESKNSESEDESSNSASCDRCTMVRVVQICSRTTLEGIQRQFP